MTCLPHFVIPDGFGRVELAEEDLRELLGLVVLEVADHRLGQDVAQHAALHNVRRRRLVRPGATASRYVHACTRAAFTNTHGIRERNTCLLMLLDTFGSVCAGVKLTHNLIHKATGRLESR